MGKLQLKDAYSNISSENLSSGLEGNIEADLKGQAQKYKKQIPQNGGNGRDFENQTTIGLSHIPSNGSQRAKQKDYSLETEIYEKGEDNGNNSKDGRSRSLKIYFKDIGRIPLLKREEEKEIGHQIKDLTHKIEEYEKKLDFSVENLAYRIEWSNENVFKNYRELVKKYDEAINILVKANLRFVVKIARNYRGYGLSHGDLINNGNAGLIQAAKKFDVDKGVKFITYAVWWIRQEIMQGFAKNGYIVRIPLRDMDYSQEIRETEKTLLQKLKREPTSDDIAEKLDIGLERVEAIIRATSNHSSLDKTLSEEGDIFDTSPRYVDMLVANTPEYGDEIEADDLSSAIGDLLKEKLTNREEKVLKMRYGFEGESMTLEEIGNKLGLSKERIRQIEKRAKWKLRRNPEIGELHRQHT